MDVSGWTIAQRMRFPDWCFGNRQIIGVHTLMVAAGTWYFAISDIAMPDPVCIWSFGFWQGDSAFNRMFLRIGLRATVPVNDAEMNGADEIFPYLGLPMTGPNRFITYQTDTVPFIINVRKGMATGAKKIVIAASCTVAGGRVDAYLVVSELPTRMISQLAHDKV